MDPNKPKLMNYAYFKSLRFLAPVMKVFLLLFCTSVFSFSPHELFSQNTTIQINKNHIATVDEVFELIRNQTDYNFIYEKGLFRQAAKIPLKKGEVHAGTLLKKILPDDQYHLSMDAPTTIVVTKMEPPKEVLQQRLTGQVTESDRIPLAGVNIIVNDNERGVVSDFDGNYVIDLDPGDRLTFSYVGFITQEFNYVNQSTLDVMMQEDVSQLSEILVVGYGNQQKDKIGSAVSQLKSEEIEMRSQGLLNIERVLGGQVKVLDVCVEKLLKKQDVTRAQRILERYTTQKFEHPKDWKKWLDKNRDRLFFSDTGGYKFRIKQ